MSKVHTIARAAAAMAGSTAAIADGAMTQVTKDSGHADAKRVATTNDRGAAAALASVVMAQAMANDQTWRGYALQLVMFTIEGREAFVDIIDAQLKQIKAANTLDGTIEAKTAAKRVNSATVEVSKLKTIAKAFNSGASIEGLQEYAAQTTKTKGTPALEFIGYTLMVEYARLFSESKAGRKADTWLVKMGKFLEKNAPAEDDKVGQQQREAFIALYNKFTA